MTADGSPSGQKPALEVAPFADMPRIEAFKLFPDPPPLFPGAPERSWMSAFHDRHPYRCLPLSIANTHCWEILVPAALEISWNGGKSVEDLNVRPLGDWPAGLPFHHFVHSNFSRGIVTFHTGYLFRTPPGWNLLATGRMNDPRPGIAPLSGIMETDWLPYPFTMNWQMTAPGFVRFEKGDAFCAIMPIPKSYLEPWRVELHEMADDPVLVAEHATFREDRDAFMRRFRDKVPEALKQPWQRHYFLGRHPDGTPVLDHSNKLRLARPIDRAGTRPVLARDHPASATAAHLLADDAKAAAPSVRDVGAMAAAEVPVTFTEGTRPWRPESILNKIDHVQDERNRLGRKRLNKGVLLPSPNTRTFDPARNDGGLDFICMPAFLRPEECRTLCRAALTISGKHNDANISDPYWKTRILFIADVKAADPPAALVMGMAQMRITRALAEFYALTRPVYADTIQLVRWPAGMFMPPHADRANPDGSTHGMPHRDFASLVYINDDYEGGELYFPRLDLVIRPTLGMMVAFTGGWHHEHGVLMVKSGLRLTMPAFYTLDGRNKDRTFYVD